MQEEITKAKNTAIKTLRANYTEQGILASRGHWRQIWLRDAMFASFGALSLEEQDITAVKNTISNAFTCQKPNGRIPLRLGKGHFWLQFFMNALLNKMPRLDTKLTMPVYRIDKFPWLFPVDGNSLVVIVLGMLMAEDKSFVAQYYTNAVRSVQWLERFDRDNDVLLEQGMFADWADCLKRKGKVLYTNVLWYKALKSLDEISRILGVEGQNYREKAELVKERINKEFWNGEFYLDTLHKLRNFSTDGNLLAILFDVANKEQALNIENYIMKNRIDAVPCYLNHPNYNSNSISIVTRLAGIPDYHTSMTWLWLGCLDVVCKHKLGLKQQAIEELLRISRIINKQGSIFEVYEQDGSPVNRRFYKAATDFSWSAGLFVYACNAIGL